MATGFEQDGSPSFSDLPDELLAAHVLLHLDVGELARVASVSRRLAMLGSCPRLWKTLYLKRWEQLTPLQERAAKLAGSWRELYRCRMHSEAEANGWHKPCDYELRAACSLLAEHAAARAEAVTPKLPPPTPSSSSSGTAKRGGSPPGSPRDPFSASPALSPQTSRVLRISPAPSLPATGAAGVAGAAGPSAAAPVSQQAGPSSATSMSMSTSETNDADTAPHSPSSHSSHSSDPMVTDEITPSRPSSSGVMSWAVGGGHSSATAAAVDEPAAHGREAQLIYLLDGSGSVSEEDFTEMRRFVGVSAPLLCAALGAPGSGKVGVVQFSTEPRVELPLAPLPDAPGDLADALEGMVRINGGTNISTAIARAGAMLREAAAAATALPPAAAATAGAAPGPASASAIPTAAIPVPQRASAGGSAAAAAPPPVPARIVLLLTDGRVDGYQAREARATASRLCDELPGCVLAAFGVGRGVDRTEMLTIVGGNSPLVGGAEVLPPPPPQHHQQAYQHLYQQPPPPPPHPVHYAQGPVQGVHGVVAAAQAQVAVAAVVPAPAQPPYHPLYLDLYTRDDAPW
eukprot:CAMPEP_0202858490 /NCGR_PEP_ID=MMETSP1391-20130828/1002_1 /ASSEMBLY_ACC=CAM_ASM_000867 /TAXON_ID=1034604 /ORGANISM="Chlamydomonas leiostraca, Strain SAG 11-49" /LENGTH=572 /DNA_ID=CAMNT_0049537415 /DNA_START=117 /DNA_END=1835 /DNA_ORIENTATION=+